MWSKAPAVKEKEKPKQTTGGRVNKSKAVAAPAVDADAALRSAQQVVAFVNSMSVPHATGCTSWVSCNELMA